MRARLSQIVEMDWGMSGDDELDLLSPNSSRMIRSFSDEFMMRNNNEQANSNSNQ